MIDPSETAGYFTVAQNRRFSAASWQVGTVQKFATDNDGLLFRCLFFRQCQLLNQVSECRCALVICMPALSASRRRRRMAVWRSIRVPRLLVQGRPAGHPRKRRGARFLGVLLSDTIKQVQQIVRPFCTILSARSTAMAGER
jgi:hypothetical protein